MGLRAGARSAKSLCFDSVSRITVGTDRVGETGLFDNPVSTQSNDAEAKDLGDCNPGRMVGNQLFALTPEQRKET